MSNPYIGEIRMFAGNFAPSGWEFCNGQLLSIAENDVLFNLIGTTYGGDGQTTFALPDLRGRIPIHQGQLAGGGLYAFAQQGGTETVVLSLPQMPSHNHAPQAFAPTGTQPGPGGGLWARSAELQYSSAAPSANMDNTLGNTGRNQPHNNMMPYLAVSFIISLFGIFPSWN